MFWTCCGSSISLGVCREHSYGCGDMSNFHNVSKLHRKVKLRCGRILFLDVLTGQALAWSVSLLLLDSQWRKVHVWNAVQNISLCLRRVLWEFREAMVELPLLSLLYRMMTILPDFRCLFQGRMNLPLKVLLFYWSFAS